MDSPDEIREYNYRINNPSEFIEPHLDVCDVCLSDKEDCRISPDGGGFCCPDCLKNSERVIEYYTSNGVSKEQMIEYFYKLKIK